MAASFRESSSGQPVVVGVADHSGWAHLVTVAAVSGAPTLVDRRRVELIDTGVPNQPYHHETLVLSDEDAERLLHDVRRSIANCTARALDRLSADLAPRYRVSAIAIRPPTLPQLPATVAEAQRSYHVRCRADGMLYHTAICDAARRRAWKVDLFRRDEGLTKAAEVLRVSQERVERFVTALGKSLPPPWTAEHRDAFAAAIGGLTEAANAGGLDLVETKR